jgi:hypothetical protein
VDQRDVRQLGEALSIGKRFAGWRLAVQRWPWLWPYGGLTALLILLLWPMWITTGHIISGGDAVLIYYPWEVLWRDALAARQFPFWNPYTFSGVPAFAHPQTAYLYPLHWAFVWMPPIPAMNWGQGVHILLAGLAAAWCAGRLGASKEGQALSGVAYALGSAMTGRLWAGHLNWVEGGAWLPLATGLAIQVRQPRATIFLALVVWMMILAGQPEYLIFASWWLPLWALLSAMKDGWRAAIEGLVRVGIGLALGSGLAAVQLLPTAALYSVSIRQFGMGWDFITGASLPPWHLLEVLTPTVFGDPRGGYWPGPGYEWHERLFYIGIVPLLAAFRAQGRWRWICWGCAALAIALAFGRYVPWYAWVQKVLPGYETFRIPSKHLGLAALALSLAAGLGIQRLSGHRVALGALAIAGVLGAASLTFSRWFPLLATLTGGAGSPPVPSDLSSMAALAAPGFRDAALVLAVLAVTAILPSVWAPRAQLALAVCELTLVLQPFRSPQSDPQGFITQVEALRGQERVVVAGDAGAILGNYGPIARVVQPAGYSALFNSAYTALVLGNPTPGVAFDITRPDDPVFRLLGYGRWFDRAKRSLGVVEPTPPRAWVARCVWPGTAIEVREPSFPREQCVALPSATTREALATPGPARVVAEGPGSMEIQAEGPGWLVTIQPWYPGWRAWIDGQVASVAAVDGALVGVQLSPGTHTITLRYLPAGLEAGLLISIASLIVLLGIWRWEHRLSRLAQLSTPRRP